MIKNIIPALFLLLLWGCKEDEIQLQPGVIYYSGSYQEDRCEYLLKIKNKDFFPRNLPVSFQSDSVGVLVSIQKLDDYTFCGLGVKPLQIVHIRDIELLN